VSLIRRLLVAAYLLESGVVLVITPWTGSWQHNYFAGLLPLLGRAMTNPFVRGGISGIGLITALAGLRDLAAVVLARHAARAGAPDTSGYP
jgi:hypothetical protein